MPDQAAVAQKPSLWSAGLVAGALAIIANVVILYISKSLALAPTLMPLNVAPVVIWTVIGTLGATLTYRFIARADRTFMIVAVIALLISFAPDVALLVNPFPGFGEVTASGVYSLMTMHVVAAAIIVPVLIGRSKVRP